MAKRSPVYNQYLNQIQKTPDIYTWAISNADNIPMGDPGLGAKMTQVANPVIKSIDRNLHPELLRIKTQGYLKNKNLLGRNFIGELE